MDNDRAKKSLRELAEEYIEDVAKEICECYCKYPEQWDEEKRGHGADRERYLCKLSTKQIIGGGKHGETE